MAGSFSFFEKLFVIRVSLYIIFLVPRGAFYLTS